MCVYIPKVVRPLSYAVLCRYIKYLPIVYRYASLNNYYSILFLVIEPITLFLDTNSVFVCIKACVCESPSKMLEHITTFKKIMTVKLHTWLYL